MKPENELPESQWPFRKGRYVWCIPCGCSTADPRIVKARVKHYNPAIVGDGWAVTKDQPFYCLMNGRKSEIAMARNCQPLTNAGKARLLVAIATGYEAAAARHEEHGATLRGDAKKLRQTAARLKKPKRVR